MNNFKSFIPCVCTGSGHKQVCERHDNYVRLLFYLLFIFNKLSQQYDTVSTGI